MFIGVHTNGYSDTFVYTGNSIDEIMEQASEARKVEDFTFYKGGGKTN